MRFDHFAAMAALLSLSFAGCTGVHSDLCERAAQCGGGGDLEIDRCVAELDADEETADIYDCLDPWDNYIDCLDEFGVCEGDRLRGCDAQKDAYEECVDRRERGRARVGLTSAP